MMIFFCVPRLMILLFLLSYFHKQIPFFIEWDERGANIPSVVFTILRIIFYFMIMRVSGICGYFGNIIGFNKKEQSLQVTGELSRIYELIVGFCR